MEKETSLSLISDIYKHHYSYLSLFIPEIHHIISFFHYLFLDMNILYLMMLFDKNLCVQLVKVVHLLDYLCRNLLQSSDIDLNFSSLQILFALAIQVPELVINFTPPESSPSSTKTEEEFKISSSSSSTKHNNPKMDVFRWLRKYTFAPQRIIRYYSLLVWDALMQDSRYLDYLCRTQQYLNVLCHVVNEETDHSLCKIALGTLKSSLLSPRINNVNKSTHTTTTTTTTVARLLLILLDHFNFIDLLVNRLKKLQYLFNTSITSSNQQDYYKQNNKSNLSTNSDKMIQMDLQHALDIFMVLDALARIPSIQGVREVLSAYGIQEIGKQLLKHPQLNIQSKDKLREMSILMQ